MTVKAILTTDPRGEDETKVIYDSINNPDEYPPFNTVDDFIRYINEKELELGEEIYIKEAIIE